MSRSPSRRSLVVDFGRLLDALTVRQHLTPHESVRRTMDRMVEQMGVCPTAVDQAVGRLGVEPSRSVGRLRRTELMQLARSIYRHWRQGDAVPPVDKTKV